MSLHFNPKNTLHNLTDDLIKFSLTSNLNQLLELSQADTNLNINFTQQKSTILQTNKQKDLVKLTLLPSSKQNITDLIFIFNSKILDILTDDLTKLRLSSILSQKFKENLGKLLESYTKVTTVNYPYPITFEIISNTDPILDQPYLVLYNIISLSLANLNQQPNQNIELSLNLNLTLGTNNLNPALQARIFLSGHSFFKNLTKIDQILRNNTHDVMGVYNQNFFPLNSKPQTADLLNF